MRKLSYKRLRHVESGGYGSYYKIKDTQLGVKLGLTEFRARRELETLRKAYAKTKLVPKPYYLVKVLAPDGWEFGYVMSHINGRRFLNARNTLLIAIDRDLRKKGIIHYDLHGGNILVKKTKKTTKYYVIDFDPRFVKVK
jgi:RIO-like serine/threonine protein kinase